MKVLFVCNMNMHRSPTAEALFKDAFETRSAGLYNEHPVTAEHLRWAGLIVVMEDEQRIELGRRFPELYLQKRIVSLGIPDIYRYDQPELKDALRQKMQLLV